MYKRIQIISIFLMLVFFTIICLFPVFIMFRVSLLPANKYFETPLDLSSKLDFSHYQELINSEFMRYIVNSFIISFISTILIIIIGTLAAFGIARYKFKRKEGLLSFIIGTRMGPAVVFAVPLYLMMVKLTLIDTFWGMILIYTFSNLAFCIWMMHSYFMEISSEIEESAMLDGLNEFGVFIRISVPMASTGLVATAILTFTFIWNEFFYSLVMTRTVAKTFPSHIPSFFGAYSIDWGGMFSASILGTILPVIFGIFVRKNLARGLSMGAVK
ncbi:MAG TPA: carbohydrate ABC transporter permease [Christensenellaceae bacterium]|nr:carbohydrate ABC transporter permease [Christensenellaceae bacterium]